MPRSEPHSILPYGRQCITQEDIDAVVQILHSPYLTQGPSVPSFELAVSARVDSRYAVAVNSATSALHIACLALGLAPGDWLWTTPITFVASANCGHYCGAFVDFVDIDPKSGLMCVSALKDKLQEADRIGVLPKVVVPVHLGGSSCDMSEISKLSQYYGFAILEDASHAIGGSYYCQPVGSCLHSSITVFSFHPVKIITTGEGGIATTNDPVLARIMQDLRNHGIVRESNRFLYPPDGPWSYEMQQLGFNYRMTDLQAALGISQLQRLNDIIKERNFLLDRYNELLSDLPFKLLAVPNNVLTAAHLAVVQLPENQQHYHRKVFEGLRKSGIGIQLHYSPVHLQPFYRRLGFSYGDYPVAEAYSKVSFSLPLFPGLTFQDQLRVVDELAIQASIF